MHRSGRSLVRGGPPRRLLFLPLALAAVTSACASAGGAPGEAGAGDGRPAPAPSLPWAIKTRPHVDLWLHGFAMISEDTARVPFFRRNYRSEMQALRNQQNVVTQLDANRDRLALRLRENTSLAASGQFLPLYFGTWDDLRNAATYFTQARDSRRPPPSQQAADVVDFLSQNFPTPADREWFRIFMLSLEDEKTRFYDSYWNTEHRNRADVLSGLDTLWHKTYYPKFSRFLRGSQQASGEILLSMPIGGEGRTVGSSPLAIGGSRTVTVTYPARASETVEAIYVFTHEIVGGLMSTVISDNTSPAEKRSGVADQYSAHGLVVGGYMLLQKIAPELAEGYARYYLRVANASAGANVESSLMATFPLPQNFRSAFSRQLDIVLGGI